MMAWKTTFEGRDRLCKIVSHPKVGVLNVEFALKLRIYSSKFNMSQMNPKEVFHNTTYSVQLAYIAGHSL